MYRSAYLAALSALAGVVRAAPQTATVTSPIDHRYGVISSATAAVASALPSVLGDWPTLSEIESKLDLSDSDLENVSTSALLVPSYSNYTDNTSGWNVRFYGFIYKLPNVSTSTLDSLVDGLSTSNLNATQSSLLQNRTQDLAAIPVGYSTVSAIVSANGSTVTDESGVQLNADGVGEIDHFEVVQGLKGNWSETQVVELGVLNVTGPGNGTSILVPQTGVSVVSDIDDVLRVTKVYVPNQGLYNSFVQPYVNENGMPELFQRWLESLPSVAFHYDTTTPLELTRTYVNYLFSNYPLGSLEMRPVNLTDPSQILDARQDSLLKLFQSFPQRKFVLVGDTSSSTLLSAYPQIATQFPDQLACIFIRNTSSTDSDDKLPYDTSSFQNVSSDKYFFYVDPMDLYNLDIANGQCVNSSITQNVTFGEQGGVLDNGAVLVQVPRWAVLSIAALTTLLVL